MQRLGDGWEGISGSEWKDIWDGNNAWLSRSVSDIESDSAGAGRFGHIDCIGRRFGSFLVKRIGCGESEFELLGIDSRGTDARDFSASIVDSNANGTDDVHSIAKTARKDVFTGKVLGSKRQERRASLKLGCTNRSCLMRPESQMLANLEIGEQVLAKISSIRNAWAWFFS
jgi:hypothetical protein